MTVLKISNPLKQDVKLFIKKVKNYFQPNLDLAIKNNHHFNSIYESVNQILIKNDFVIIKNLGFTQNKAIFESFVKLFGDFYGQVEYTDIKLECNYTGCNYQQLQLHNDDALDLLSQPTYGFIRVLNEDPVKNPLNGIVKINELAHYLEIFDPKLLNDLLTIKVPMLSYGINYDGNNKDKIIIQESILYVIDNIYYVRFDFGRIAYYYWHEKKEQSSDEKLMILKFIELCKKFRKQYFLEKGDILIHHNKKTLHDRTECCLELNIDGTFHSREIFVSFTR